MHVVITLPLLLLLVVVVVRGGGWRRRQQPLLPQPRLLRGTLLVVVVVVLFEHMLLLWLWLFVGQRRYNQQSCDSLSSFDNIPVCIHPSIHPCKKTTRYLFLEHGRVRSFLTKKNKKKSRRHKTHIKKEYY